MINCAIFDFIFWILSSIAIHVVHVVLDSRVALLFDRIQSIATNVYRRSSLNMFLRTIIDRTSILLDKNVSKFRFDICLFGLVFMSHNYVYGCREAQNVRV